MLLQCATEQRSTLLVSLHTLDLLREGFDRVVALRDGRIAWQGRPADLTRGDLQSVYGAEYRALHLDEVALDGTSA
jgi:phosphonate transport system ATP-binding protein